MERLPIAALLSSMRASSVERVHVRLERGVGPRGASRHDLCNNDRLRSTVVDPYSIGRIDLIKYLRAPRNFICSVQ